MSNKYLEKIAQTLSEKEISDAATRNVRSQMIGGIATPIGAHFLGKSQINKLEEHLGRTPSGHKEVLRRQIGDTLKGAIPGGLAGALGGTGVGLVLSGGRPRSLITSSLAGIGGAAGAIYGEYAGTKNWMRRMYGEGSDTSSK